MRISVVGALLLLGCVGQVSGEAVDAGEQTSDASIVDDAGASDSGLLDAGTSVDAGRPDAGQLDAGLPWDGGYTRGDNCGAIDAAVVIDDGGTPAWLVGAPLGGFVAIAGTAGSGVSVNAYNGFTLKTDSSEIFLLAVGGHSDSYDNRVVSISLLADSPHWQLRCTPSTHRIENAGYYDDGAPGLNPKPGSTHTYDYTAWVPQAGGSGRLMRYGMFGTWPSGFGAPNVDGFDPVANQWDLPGTWPDTPGVSGTARDGETGEVYVAGGSKKITPDGGLVAVTTVQTVRFPNAWDSKRNAIFGLSFGDGQGYNPELGVVARFNDLHAHTKVNITFNPSAALTQFIHDQPAYAGMDYDPDNDRYLFYAAADYSKFPITPTPDRIYVITPNATTTWDMSVLTLQGSVVPADPPSSGAGINGRFKYVPRLKGFVLLPSQTSPLYFLKTAG